MPRSSARSPTRPEVAMPSSSQITHHGAIALTVRPPDGGDRGVGAARLRRLGTRAMPGWTSLPDVVAFRSGEVPGPVQRLVLLPLDNGPKDRPGGAQFLKRWSTVPWADWVGVRDPPGVLSSVSPASTTRSNGAGLCWSGSGMGVTDLPERRPMCPPDEREGISRRATASYLPRRIELSLGIHRGSSRPETHLQSGPAAPFFLRRDAPDPCR